MPHRKRGLIGLTKDLCRELGPHSILTNVIARRTSTPSSYRSTRTTRDPAERDATWYAELVPLGRLQSPEQIAAAVSFLAAPRASAVIGQVLQRYGGVTRTRA